MCWLVPDKREQLGGLRTGECLGSGMLGLLGERMPGRRLTGGESSRAEVAALVAKRAGLVADDVDATAAAGGSSGGMTGTLPLLWALLLAGPRAGGAGGESKSKTDVAGAAAAASVVAGSCWGCCALGVFARCSEG